MEDNILINPQPHPETADDLETQEARLEEEVKELRARESRLSRALEQMQAREARL